MLRKLRVQTVPMFSVGAIVGIAVLGMVLPSQAAKPEDVQRLLQTQACPGCDLSNADLSYAHLIGADLREANLQGANLEGANLEGADMTGADLRNAQLFNTYLTNASLNRSNLANANLTNAIAFHVDTRGANLSNLTIAGAEIYGSGISVGGEAPPEGETFEEEMFMPEGVRIPIPEAAEQSR